jgi:hypothetical protein
MALATPLHWAGWLQGDEEPLCRPLPAPSAIREQAEEAGSEEELGQVVGLETGRYGTG